MSTETAAPQAGKIVSAGAVSRFTTDVIPAKETNGGNGAGNEGEGNIKDENEGLSPEEIAAKAKGEKPGETQQQQGYEDVELSDEQLQKLLDKKGIKVNSIAELHEKFNPKEEPSEEEKNKELSAKEKRVLDLFLANGGTIEQFAAMKSVASMDVNELAKTSLVAELKAANFNDEEIATILTDRYYQIKLEELTPEVGEDDKEFEARKAAIEKKMKYGTSKLENRGKSAQQKAKDTIANLYKAIEDSDSEKRESEKEESELSSKVDEISSKVARKVTLKLGKAKADDAEEIAPIEYNVDESDIAEVAAMLKDPAKRNNITYNSDGKIDVNATFERELEIRNLKKALIHVFTEGQSRQVAFFEKMFPLEAKQIGVGGASTKNTGGTPGKFASVGKPEVFRPR